MARLPVRSAASAFLARGSTTTVTTPTSRCPARTCARRPGLAGAARRPARARTDGQIDLGDLPDRLGRHRARQGVDLDDLVRADAARLPVLVGAAGQSDDPPRWRPQADRLWKMVDAYAREVHFAFHRQAGPCSPSSNATDRAPPARPAVRPGRRRRAPGHATAARLGVRADGTFGVCAALADHAARCAGGAASRRRAPAGGRVQGRRVLAADGPAAERLPGPADHGRRLRRRRPGDRARRGARRRGRP
ncbi:hypothetical protein HBB16_00775 [Pseudonocardia sp. MCCB 268]|nr:hypothetical protein [Pseudonocardia cytotoxica]